MSDTRTGPEGAICEPPEGIALSRFGLPFRANPAQETDYTASQSTTGAALLVEPCYVDRVEYLLPATASKLLTLYDDADATSLTGPITTLDLAVANMPPVLLQQDGEEPYGITQYAQYLQSMFLGVEVSNGLCAKVSATDTINDLTVFYSRGAVPGIASADFGGDGFVNAHGHKLEGISGAQFYNKAYGAADTDAVQIVAAPCYLSHIIFGFLNAWSSEGADLSIYDHASASSNLVLKYRSTAFFNPNKVMLVGRAFTAGLRFAFATGVRPDVTFVYHTFDEA